MKVLIIICVVMKISYYFYSSSLREKQAFKINKQNIYFI